VCDVWNDSTRHDSEWNGAKLLSEIYTMHKAGMWIKTYIYNYLSSKALSRPLIVCS